MTASATPRTAASRTLPGHATGLSVTPRWWADAGALGAGSSLLVVMALWVSNGGMQQIAGGGADGNEGRYPVKEGDAFFFRLNTTVGFYSGAKEGDPHDLILAVRSLYPFPANLIQR